MIARNDYLAQLEKWAGKKIIKIITGIRRCGKSTLMTMFRNHLLATGILESRILYVNFEDIENEPLLDYNLLYRKIKERIVDNDMYYLFFDEIQLVSDFQKVIDSLYLLDNIDIYLTGSNAYLLSGEIATMLTGRYVEIKMYPLSFKEFVSARPESMDPEKSYRRFTEFGGFPYTLGLGDDREIIRDYLSGIYNTVLLKDVVARNRISDVMVLESLIRFLADNIGNLSSAKRISDSLTSSGRKISSHTVENYITSLVDSYIFYPASRYDIKGMQFMKTGCKYYLADAGLRNIIIGTRTGDLGRVLENVIFLELKRRGGEVYVGKQGENEVDFVVIRGGDKEYYQVALSVRDENTLQRELSPLLGIHDHNPKYLLTLDNDPIVNHDGVKQIFAIDWLLEN